MPDAQVLPFRSRAEQHADNATESDETEADTRPVVVISSATIPKQIGSPLHKLEAVESSKANWRGRVSDILDKATSIEFGRKAYATLLGVVAVGSLGIVAGRTVIDESIIFNPGMTAPDTGAPSPDLLEKTSPGTFVSVTATEGSNPTVDAIDALPEGAPGSDVMFAAEDIARQTGASIDGTRGYQPGETSVLVVPNK